MDEKDFGVRGCIKKPYKGIHEFYYSYKPQLGNDYKEIGGNLFGKLKIYDGDDLVFENAIDISEFSFNTYLLDDGCTYELPNNKGYTFKVEVE